MARLGNCTGSRVVDALSILKRASNGRTAGDSSQARLDYMLELALGRVTGIVEEHYVTPAMQDGIDREPHAVAAYEAVTGNAARKVGIAPHPVIERYLSSPDRYIGDKGILEVKAPTPAVHLGYIRDNVVPELYVPQCLSHLACSPDRDWCDFESFHPGFPIKLQVFIAPRMYRSEWAMKIAEIEDGVRKFLAETATLTAELEALAESRKF